MKVFVVPLSIGIVRKLLQSSPAMPLLICCSVKSVDNDGHEIASVFVAVRVRMSDGAWLARLLRDDW
jgi:hypothetical protein